MSYISATTPHCRNCGKPIPKRITTIWFDMRGPESTFARYVPDVRPRNKVEAQRHSNQTIVSVRYSEGYRETDGKYVCSAGEWDGETYTDEFFCRQPCAVRFAYAAARMAHDDGRPKLAMPAYWEAISGK